MVQLGVFKCVALDCSQVFVHMYVRMVYVGEREQSMKEEGIIIIIQTGPAWCVHDACKWKP